MSSDVLKIRTVKGISKDLFTASFQNLKSEDPCFGHARQTRRCRPAAASRSSEGYSQLLASFDFRRDQADLDIGVGHVGDIDNLGYVLKGQVVVALHEHDFLCAGLVDV